MQFNGYNLINQKLDSEWLIKLLRFCSNDYTGAVGESEDDDPLTITGSNFTLLPCTFAIGGHTVDMTPTYEEEYLKGTILSHSTSYNFYGIVLGIDKDKETTNITTNQLSSVTAGYIQDFAISQITSDQSEELIAGPYYEIKQVTRNEQGTVVTTGEGWDRYHYDTCKFSNVEVIPVDSDFDPTSSQSSPAPISIPNAYVIPVVGYDETDGKVVRLLGYKTGSALEEFLTKAAIDKLLEMMNDRFVWRTGGTEGHRERGDVGNLNIRGNNIYCDSTYTDRDDIQYYLKNSVTIRADYIRFCRVHNSEWGKEEETDNFLPYGVLVVPEPDKYQKGIDSIRKLPIELGGTNATTVNRARRNLGIVTSADRHVNNNGKPPSSTSTWQPEDGTIYLSIVN